MHSLSRREFLRVGALGAGLAALPLRAEGLGAPPPIGLQLYTLRDLMKEDFDGTLKRVAEIGYPAVEFAGFGRYGGKPQELRALLDGLGLVCCGSHEGLGGIERQPAARAEFVQALGGRHLVVPSLPKEFRDGGKDGYRQFGERMNALGEAVAKAGGVLSYHNHAFEFAKDGDKTLFDWMLEAMDPELVKLEVDVFWVKNGGIEPGEFIRRHRERIALLHMKDLAADDGSFAPVGTGTLDMADIAKAGGEAGCDWYIVEQDACRQPPLEAVALSLGNLKALLG
ncbi:MAG: sugar phosphate isomerase/epimerase [Lentisphaeria bacterium]|jgi:sugar phosphate isomerase/epimerase|nr:sugar phosphate isomerase/epimerase [Lentisphaeria bacterium]